MMQPKRTRYRKQQKGRNRGLATTGNRVSFGEYGMKATTRGRITARQIEAAPTGDYAQGQTRGKDLDSDLSGQADYQETSGDPSRERQGQR